jgi:hypothetical protein
MANVYYRDRLVMTYASNNPSTKDWSAGAEITWKKDDQRFSHSIGGLTDRFKSSEDAEQFAMNLAKAWIDANP